MRVSDHLARGHRPEPEHRPDRPASRRWPDSLLVVLCCALDLLLPSLGGSLLSGSLAEPPVAVALPVVALAVPALAYRRRAPGLVFGGMWLHGIGSMLVLGFRPVAGLALALHAITVHARRSTGFLALSVALVPSAAGALVATVLIPGARPAAALGIAATVLVGGWLAGQRAHARYRRDMLRRRRQQALREEAAAAERYRLTHDLLGIITHCLSAILLQAAGARRVLACDPEQAAKALATIETSGIQATGELYRLLGVLRTSGLSQVGALQLAAPRQSAALTDSDPATVDPATVAGVPAWQPRPAGAARTEPVAGPAPHGRLRLSELRSFLDQARAAGVPLRVRTEGRPGGADAGPELSGAAQDADTVEMRWSDGALELVVGDRVRLDQVPNPRSRAREAVPGSGTGPLPGSLSRSGWLSESA